MNKSELPVERRFMTALSTAARRMRTAYDGIAGKQGLTLSRARALLRISATPGVNQTGLARFLEIENPSVVRILDGLEKQGLIRRRATAGDRRAKQIVLAPAAMRQVAELEEISNALGRDMLKGVSARDLGAAVRVLGTVIGNLQTPA
jgi:MarR family transcriptional regulator for hemolysin